MKAIKAKGGTAAFFAADAIALQPREAHEKLEAKLGRSTILINAAGGNDPKVTVTTDHPFESIKLEDWHELRHESRGGVLLHCQEFARPCASAARAASSTSPARLSTSAALACGDVFGSEAAVLNLSKFSRANGRPKACG